MASSSETTPVLPPGLPPLLLILAGVTGLVDAASILGLGKVFTANMTGNIVFLGFASVGTPGFNAESYLIAIGAFVLGAVLGGRLGHLHSQAAPQTWLIRVALVESALLLAAAGTSFLVQVPDTGIGGGIYAIIALTAVAMGLRNATVRQLKVPDLTTTVLTLTITGLAADSIFAGNNNHNWSVRIASVVAIFFGAAVGAILVTHLGLAVTLSVAALMTIGGTLVWANYVRRKVSSRTIGAN